MSSNPDVIVIGAGQAGLAISFCLQQKGVAHLVLERARIGETWRTQRWDSFVLNSPNQFNVLPGESYQGPDPEGFGTAGEFAAYLEEYAARHRLPVYEHTPVHRAGRNDGGFSVTVSNRGREEVFLCRNLVIASGGMNEGKVPPFAGKIPPEIRQYHAGNYRNPSQLPDGSVLVVGSAQSGLQIAEDLVDSGRKVYLSTSAVGRVPRRYRGRDILDWLLTIGFYDVTTESVTDPRELNMRPPQVSGRGPLGHTHSLQSLAGRGVEILGRLDDADGHMVRLQPNAADNVRFSDQVSLRIRALIETYIEKNHLEVPPRTPDTADEPDPDAACANPATTLDLKEAEIRSIVWTTGFTGSLNYLDIPVYDSTHAPKHINGMSAVDGLQFIGWPWLRKRKSGIICGIAEDAEFLAGRIAPG